MVNWLGLLLLILVVIIAWRLWSSSYSAGSVFGGAGKKAPKDADSDEEPKEEKKHKSSESSVSYKEFQSYTITEDGHFVRASFNDHGGKQSILVLYNNGSRDKDGKVTQGEIQIAFKIEDGKIDKENVKLQGVENLDDRGRAAITKALMSLKARFDAATSAAIKSTLEWIEL